MHLIIEDLMYVYGSGLNCCLLALGKRRSLPRRRLKMATVPRANLHSSLAIIKPDCCR